MNERIKELAEQCGFMYHETVGLVAGPNASGVKFAELIVRECADTAAGERSGWEARKAIEEHFGVEE
jgi:rubredoxin